MTRTMPDDHGMRGLVCGADHQDWTTLPDDRRRRFCFGMMASRRDVIRSLFALPRRRAAVGVAEDRRRVGGIFALLAVAMSLIVAAALVLTGPAAAQDRRVPSSVSEMQLSFAPVVKKIAPAVVNVYAERVVAEQPSPFMNDPFFQRFFGDRFSLGIPRERVERSLGSGVIVDPKGVIVTNYHVIAGGRDLTVALADRREFKAEVLLTDERSDLAVLKIDPQGERLPSVSFKDADMLEVGDLVLAIGNPFGVGQTVTSGIVSALARTQVGANDWGFFIQTDAPINPGNSGGALVTTDGKLVGVNSTIISRTGGSVGIGFAIPSNMVKLVVEAALEGEPVRRPWLGAHMQPVTAELASSLGLDRPAGALLRDVFPDGPADRAGLGVGDVIRTIDGRLVEDPQAVRYRLATKGLGAKAQIGYVRNGRPGTVALRLEPPPENPPRDLTTLSGRNPFSGAVVGNLSPAVAEELGLDDPMQKGVVVFDTEPGSPAASLNLRSGDILRSLGAEPVESVDQLQQILNRPTNRWTFRLLRGGREFSMTLGG